VRGGVCVCGGMARYGSDGMRGCGVCWLGGKRGGGWRERESCRERGAVFGADSGRNFRVLQCVAECVAVYCSVLQCVAVRIQVVIHKGQNVTDITVKQDCGAGF